MAYCILPNDKEYQTLSKRSGIPSNNEQFKNYVGYFRETYNRDPHLDEIPNANSRSYLKDVLGIRDEKYANITKLKEFTLEEDPIKMQQKLNTIFRDKEIEIIPTIEETIVKIIDRPSQYKVGESDDVNIEKNPDSTTFFIDGLYKLINQYGIKFKITSDKEIEEKFLDLNAQNSKAFIYDGDIYINIDKADLNSPIHEMLHLLVGSMRFTSQDSYQHLLDITQKLPEFNSYLSQYPNRTLNDLTEEILIENISKLLTSKDHKIPKEYMHDIFYEIKRNLDTLLMGKYSVNSIPINDVFDMSILDIGKAVQSSRLVNNFNGLLSDAFTHRLLNNIKSDLLKSEQLKQICT